MGKIITLKELNNMLPGDLFPCDEKAAKQKYRDLSRTYHPDSNKSADADSVFQKITELYHAACDDIKAGVWHKKNFIRLITEDGRKLDISFKHHGVFEIGEYYVCNKVVVYVINKGCDKYYDNALLRIKSLTFESGKMEEMRNFFPTVHSSKKLNDGRLCMVLNKAEDMYPLRCILNAYNGKIPDKHVAWIINRLSNLACYLQYSNLVSNGFNVENVFISPTKHAACLMGGWWYTVPKGAKMIGTTKQIFNVMPVTIKTSKVAANPTDLEAIKLIGREILGEPNQRKLQLIKDIPAPIVKFMVDGAGKCAYDEFGKYHELLDKAYGQRKFIKMELTDKQIYNL